MSDASIEKLNPPYLPYRTFLNSLQNLSQGVPPRIDRGIWKNQPGGVQSQIMGAYRFFGLVDEASKPTKRLQELVDKRMTPNDNVKPLLEDKYADIFKHNLSTMTASLLEDYFEATFKVQGEVKRKSITFFLQAAKAVGIPLSQFLQSQVRNTTGTRKRRTRREDEDGAEDGEVEDDDPQSGSSKTVELVSGGTLTLTVSVDVIMMAAEDRTFVFGLIDQLHAYEQQGKSKAVSGVTK